jgi:hypothetical protein
MSAMDASLTNSERMLRSFAEFHQRRCWLCV